MATDAMLSAKAAGKRTHGRTKRPTSASRCLHGRFEEQVVRTPDAIALVGQGESLTYAELNSRANQLAHYLRASGVKPGQLVGLHTERGIGTVVSILGILKAGGAYLPLDPVYPKDRIAFMLEDSRVSFVVTEESLASNIEGTDATVVLPTDYCLEQSTNPNFISEADDLAYVIYTSGSTGKPKGALISHRNVTRLFDNTVEWYHFNANDVWTLFHSYSFDFSVWEIWGALLYGGRLVVVPYEISRSVEDFRELILREGVTVLNQTPSAFRQFIQADMAQPKANYALRYVIFGGEALEFNSLQPWFERYGDNKPLLINMYGITETTVHVTYRPVRFSELGAGQGSVIGGPIPDLQLHILDEEMKPVPDGTEGEMYVGGAGVAQGYLNRPELTAQRFLPDPFSKARGARIYRTGDLARRLENGDIEYLGRIDHQVKIRGYRIELGEIEASIASDHDVREVVVIAREDVPGDKRLVAYIVAGDTQDDLAQRLRENLRVTLPDYMVPSHFVPMDVLPLTENGKIDRAKLPAPDRGVSSADYVAPSTPHEEIVAQVWGEVLGLDRIGVNDNFFELGGHSLLVIDVIQRLRMAGLHVDVSQLFLEPTIAGVARVATDDWQEIDVPPSGIPADCQAIDPGMLPLVDLQPEDIELIVKAVPGGAANIQDIYPLAPLQEGMLFHHRMAGAGDPYLVTTLFGSDSREQLDRYLEALQLVIDRHDILRTAFLWEGLPEPVQVVCRNAPLHVETLELDPADGDIAEQLLQRYDPRQFRLDVRQTPIIRVFIAHDPAHDRWVMLRVHHHLMEDHTTDELISEEIIACLEGKADQLPAPLPYRNFVMQARHVAQSDEYRNFFEAMLSDVDEPTVPFGLTDVLGEGAPILETRRLVDKSLADRLRKVAHRNQVSAASLFHLAWAKVVSQCAGRDDVVFGTVLFGRMHAGLGAERVFGPFINSLPLRLQVGEVSILEGIRQTHRRMAELLRHEHASLAMAQGCSAVAANVPLFSALLNFRHVKIQGEAGEAMNHAMAVAIGKMGLELLKFEERTNYPLELSVDDLGDGFMLEAQVQSPIDPSNVCGYMSTALDQLVTALEEAPGSLLSELDVLPEAERHRLLVEWNDTARTYDAPERLHALIEAQAARTPDAIALEFEGEELTYGQLNARANQLARMLRRKGVGPDVLVGVFAERSFEMVISLLAVLKAGGAYVPLDPSYPSERLGHMLEDARAPIVLCQPHLAEQLPEVAGDVHLLDPSWKAYEQEADEDLEDIGSPTDLAYAIFTSGSTGRPKGAMNEHRGICNRLQWMQEQYRLTPEDRVLQKTPFSFDVSVWEFFWPLLAGARMVIARPEGHRDSAYLVDVIHRSQVTTAHFVPSMLRVFLEDDRLESCSSLRRVLCSGEALPYELQQRFFARLRDTELHNLYGPTEAAVDVTYWACKRDDERTKVPIGRPVANTQIHILDTRMEPVPIGVAGEIYIGGVQVGRGYVGRDDLTAERFVPDPYSDRPGARLYKTGDLGRYLPDGAIEYLGRTDFQVKIRGQRIELGEIEATLDTHPQVGQSVVVAREDAAGARLVAYVVADGDKPDTAQLREHLGQLLPAYMVPSAFVLLDALPLTSSGKVDRRALPEPDVAATRAEYVAPSTPTEQKLAEIWQDILGLDRVSVDDDFFELGGHSLLAVSVIERMRRLGLNVDVRSLFTTPTIAALSKAIGDNSSVIDVPENRIPEGCTEITPNMLPLVQLSEEQIGQIAARIPGGVENIQDIYPLAPLQEGFLFHHRATSEGDLYIMATQFAFDSRERLDRYVETLQWVVDRHDILRTAFLWEGLDKPVQVVCRHAPVRVQEVSLDPADGDIAGQLSKRFNLLNYRFDMEVPPMIRIFVAHDAANDRWLYHQLNHHLMEDQASGNIQEEEIEAHLLGRTDQLPAPSPFRNYVAQARLGLPQEEYEAFFRDMLSDVDEPTTPFGFTDVLGNGAHIDESRLFLDPVLTRRLFETAQRMGISTASLFHEAFALMLSRLSGRDDVVFGTLLLGRMLSEGAGRIVGPCINTLPIRIPVGESAIMDGVQRTHALLAKILQYEHAPLGLTQRCSGLKADTPVFSSILNYRRPSRGIGNSRLDNEAETVLSANAAPDGDNTHDGWTYRDIPGRKFVKFLERTNYPLTLSVDDLGDGFRLVAQVQSPIDPSGICQYMSTALDQLVTALEEAPGSLLSELDVLPEAERHRLLVEWNDTARTYDAPERLHALIEAQAARTPDAIALEFEGEELTYGQLNARANQLARMLRRKGVGPDVLVGVFAERSFEMVISLLAVLKAGGAYVPLDPSYPSERLGHMLEDARAPIVLCQPHLAEQLPEVAGDVHLLDPSWKAYEQEADEDLEDIGSPTDLAYAIFTSGSTGRPKGAMNEHRGICNRLQWMQEQYRLTPEDRVLQKTPFSFDVSVWEFFWPLLAGARMVIARPEGHRDSAYLVDVIHRSQVTTAHFVPSMLRVFLEDDRLESCSSLRRVLCSGEALPYELQQRFFARLRDTELHNLYGPTEAAVDVTYWACKRDDERTKVPIGRPVANTQIHILDTRMEPVPIGVAGEIYIGGVQVGRGYVGRDDLTAERFVPDPYSDRPGARLYKTGDLGRYLPDGAIEYLGRTDFQVKIRGQRIELGEIEATLDTHPQVGQSVVVAREDAAGARLVAYVVADGDKPDTAQLREHLGQLLPAYMVPSAFVLLDALPLTSSGKVDRRALPEPDVAATRAEYVAPSTPTEQKLAEIWQDILGLDRVSVDDDFFELGGHSLLALELLVHVERAHGMRIPVRAIMEGRTIRRISSVLDGSQESSLPNGIVCVRQGHSDKALFCIPGSGGGALQYEGLASRLSTSRSIYAIELHDMDLGTATWPSMHEMAVTVAQSMRQVQENGPYSLLGYSFGGNLAVEVAAELTRQGQQIELVYLIDSYAPGAAEIASQTDRFARHLRALTSVPLREAFDYFKFRGRRVLGLLPARLPEETDLQYRLRIADERGIRALHSYRPSHFSGRIAWVHALDIYEWARIKDTTGTGGWSGVCNEVEVIDIKCAHFELLNQPHLSELAEYLDNLLVRSDSLPTAA